MFQHLCWIWNWSYSGRKVKANLEEAIEKSEEDGDRFEDEEVVHETKTNKVEYKKLHEGNPIPGTSSSYLL